MVHNKRVLPQGFHTYIPLSVATNDPKSINLNIRVQVWWIIGTVNSRVEQASSRYNGNIFTKRIFPPATQYNIILSSLVWIWHNRLTHIEQVHTLYLGMAARLLATISQNISPTNVMDMFLRGGWGQGSSYHVTHIHLSQSSTEAIKHRDCFFKIN